MCFGRCLVRRLVAVAAAGGGGCLLAGLGWILRIGRTARRI